jgi:hypothetical protein
MHSFYWFLLISGLILTRMHTSSLTFLLAVIELEVLLSYGLQQEIRNDLDRATLMKSQVLAITNTWLLCQYLPNFTPYIVTLVLAVIYL